MTDVPIHVESLPARLGTTARVVDGDLVIDLEPVPAVLHHGVVRTSVLSYLVDCVAGIPLDRDPDAWTLTTDMTVRARPVPAPDRVTARFRLLREGRRSATGAVDLHTEAGEVLGTGAIGFARVPRREGIRPRSTCRSRSSSPGSPRRPSCAGRCATRPGSRSSTRRQGSSRCR